MNANEIIIPCQLSYANIWEPKSINGSDPKYSVSLIIPKKDKKTLAAIQSVIDKIKADPRSINKWGGKLPPKIKLPLRDGDEEKDDETYAGAMFMNANSSRAPRVIDGRLNDVMDQDEVYSGCYAKVKVALFAYSASGNRGIGASLEVIQKVRDGERLGGSGTGIEGFGVEDEDDDLPFPAGDEGFLG